MNKLTCLSLIKRASGNGGSGTKKVEKKQINFIDYDGTILYSYTPKEALALTELPPHGSTDPLLIFDGWNWTLEELKDEINVIGLDFMQHHKMAIGATYRTIDGATYYIVDITADDESQRTITIKLNVENKQPVTIDWGDGSQPSTLTSTTSSARPVAASHKFAKGSYAIKIDCAEGHRYSTYYEGFGQYVNYDASRTGSLKKVHFGDRLYSIPRTAFVCCYNLAAVSFPNRSIQCTESGMFQECHSLKALVFGKATGYYYLPENTAVNCSGLEIISLSRQINTAGYSYTGSNSTWFVSDCPNLSIMHIPTTTSLASGCNKTLLESVYMNKIRTTMNFGVYQRSPKLKYIKITERVTSLPKNCFSFSYLISSVSLPSTLTEIQSECFQYCGALKKIKIPKSVMTIGSYAFYYCQNLN